MKQVGDTGIQLPGHEKVKKSVATEKGICGNVHEGIED